MDFYKLGSFMNFSRKQLEQIPKEVLLACAPEEIALIWNKLPEHLKKDKDIIQYQYCTDHDETRGSEDVIDGPPPRKLFCCYCNIRDVQINAGEKESNDNFLNKFSTLLGICEQELKREHETIFRQKILAHFPNLRAEKCGREYTLTTINANLFSVLDKEDQDEDALAFQHFAKRLRRAITECKPSFNGSFEKNCEELCITAPLLGAVNTLLYGTATREDCRATQPALSICQLIILSYHQGMPKGHIVRNNKNREPPLPLYIGLSLHGKGREKTLIDELHQKAIDNIDHKTTSTTSRNEFHGTGISLFQLPEENSLSVDQKYKTSYADVESAGDRSVPELPDFYSSVPECVLPSKVPLSHCYADNVGNEMIISSNIEDIWKKGAPWLTHVHDTMAQDRTEDTPIVSWAAYYASLSTKAVVPANNAILPLFHEKATDPSMIKHAMNIVKNITQRLNRDQITVMCVDQQLYCICKHIQWQYPSEFGEELFVVMLGPLHIEKSFLAILGQYLENSGWNAVTGNSGVITSESAEGLLKVSNILKARAIHQVTACALYSLLFEAYELDDPAGITLEQWAAEKSKINPNFKYWYGLLNLEILALCFVKSIRDANFKLYKKSIAKMIPWYFLFEHQNYARWLPVHLADMIDLKAKVPSVNAEFESGKFVVPITDKKFAALGIDHAHKQNNA
ncbi:unnamed protein product [Ceutorhynchus assimilis]|uniref:Uncharacterized protein n=1 Tax=Ceutorhynchus assimilis TaxID=467358 RepID=A0A9N9QPP9_9CUCU|nr:unnamed protein product [Ceutorhynchus assimilis]